MRAAMFFTIACLVAYIGFQHYTMRQRADSIPGIEMATACYQQDTGAYTCLKDLYGAKQVSECSWYLGFDNVRGTVAEAFTDCLGWRVPAHFFG